MKKRASEFSYVCPIKKLKLNPKKTYDSFTMFPSTNISIPKNPMKEYVDMVDEIVMKNKKR